MGGWCEGAGRGLKNETNSLHNLVFSLLENIKSNLKIRSRLFKIAFPE